MGKKSQIQMAIEEFDSQIQAANESHTMRIAALVSARNALIDQRDRAPKRPKKGEQ